MQFLGEKKEEISYFNTGKSLIHWMVHSPWLVWLNQWSVWPFYQHLFNVKWHNTRPANKYDAIIKIYDVF